MKMKKLTNEATGGNYFVKHMEQYCCIAKSTGSDASLDVQCHKLLKFEVGRGGCTDWRCQRVSVCCHGKALEFRVTNVNTAIASETSRIEKWQIRESIKNYIKTTAGEKAIIGGVLPMSLLQLKHALIEDKARPHQLRPMIQIAEEKAGEGETAAIIVKGLNAKAEQVRLPTMTKKTRERWTLRVVGSQ